MARKVYTDATCPQCGGQLFSTIPPWEAKNGQKIPADTCQTHGKVTAQERAAITATERKSWSAQL